MTHYPPSLCPHRLLHGECLVCNPLTDQEIEDERIRDSYRETGHYPSCCGACEICLRVCSGNHDTEEEYNPILENAGGGSYDDGGLR